MQERFTTRGIAPTRTSSAGHIDAGLGLLVPIHGRFYAASEIGVQTHFLSIEEQTSDSHLVGRFAVRGMVVLGAWHRSPVWPT